MENEIKIFTDGSFMKKSQNKIFCGYGIHFPNKELKDVSRKFIHLPCTNQRAELYAIYKAIKLVVTSNKLKKKNISKIHIYTDSEYSIKSLTLWSKKWEENNLKNSKKEDVLNQDIIKPIYKYLKEHPNKVTFTHVRSHTNKQDFNSKCNTMADNLATSGALKQ